jgi:hypothetical protein
LGNVIPRRARRAPAPAAILRRIAYTILTLFRSVTQRSDDRRLVPWKSLRVDVFFALVATTEHHLHRLNPTRRC